MTWSYVRAALAVSLALGAGPAFAKIGVTSATAGDPLGKPPAENERVLRIGIDVQANELITTNATDRAHLVFLDGTSITVGPNARVTLDAFVFDPNTKTGELSLNAARGVFRVVGGKISKSNAITVTTPSSTLGIRGGISIFSVTSTQTDAAFVFGTSLTVTGAGQTHTITRPGFQIITNAGGPPGAPFAIPRGSLAGNFSALEGTSSGNSNADQRAQSSGFSNQNSGQGGNQLNNPFSAAQQQMQNNISSAITSGVSGANTQVQTDTAKPPTGTNTSTQSPTTPTPTIPPSDTPPTAPRTTRTLNGYAAGLITNLNGNSHQVRTPELGGPTDVSITTDASTSQVAGTAKGTLVIRQSDNSVHTLQLGGTATTAVYIDNKTYGMVTSDDPARPSTAKIGERTITTTNSTVLVSGIPPGITVTGTAGTCTCEYLSYGWWASQISYPAGGPKSGQVDVIGGAPFVAGTLAVHMPYKGTATYNGVMAGNVQNGGNSYNAVGSYSMPWDFAARSGNFSGSFDGMNYSGTAQANAGSGGVNFSGNFSGGIGNGARTGALAGSFFSAPGSGPENASKYQGGAFTISGTGNSYKAAGVFAGQR